MHTYYALQVNPLFPRLLATIKPRDPLRIWIPGCSTEEEVYSVAICLQEYLAEKALSTPFHVFGTASNEIPTTWARKGIYASGAVSSLSPERLHRFFRDVHQEYQISTSLPEQCIFAQHNLLSDPPFFRLDLLACQNVLIYLGQVAQKNMMRLFHYALIPHGILLLGPSETIGAASDLFTPFEGYRHLYRQKTTSARLHSWETFIPRPETRCTSH